MRTRTRSRIRAEAVWTLALLLGVPALAQAQQTGLFPLHPIKRERVPCAAEDPVYRQHREMYYGYFPTCWRKFPPGWGCQSPEAPNAVAEFKRLPRGNPPDLSADDGDRGGMRGDDEDLGPQRGSEPLPNRNALPPVPPAGPDLFDRGAPAREEKPPALPPPSNPANRSTPDSAAIAPVTATAPEVGLAPREADPSAAAAAVDTLAPLPALPAAELPPASSGNPLPAVDAPMGATSDASPVSNAQPERAPQRRSLLGSLFGGLRRR